MSDSAESRPEASWDGIWEDLLSRPEVRNLVLPHVDMSEVSFVHDVSTQRGVQHGESCFILVHVDDARRVYIEFCNVRSRGLMLHAFASGLRYNTATTTMDMYPGEGYSLPETTIIDLTSVLPPRNTRVIDFFQGPVLTLDMRLEMPVIHIGSRVPQLGDIPLMQSIDQVREAVRGLYESFGGAEGFTDIKLLTECAALADPQLYTSGKARSRAIDIIIQGTMFSGKGISKMDLT